MIELSEHPFFVASQFHPEFKSRPQRPAPLFAGFIAAAFARSRTGAEQARAEEARAEEARGKEARVLAPEMPSPAAARAPEP